MIEITQTTVTALISLSGIAISAYISYKTSKQQIKQKYNENLYNKRLDKYPELYEVCSSLAKRIHSSELTESNLLEARQRLDDWDSNFAILLSPVSSNAIFKLRNHIYKTTSSDIINSPEITINKIAQVENSLKTELGIFNFESFHQPTAIKDAFDALPEKFRANNKG